MTQKPTFHFNQLSEPELERLAILVEESGEVLQLVGKILRFGYSSRNPLIQESMDNRQNLEVEIGDLQNILSMMKNNQDISESKILARQEYKSKSILKWVKHQ